MIVLRRDSKFARNTYQLCEKVNICFKLPMYVHTYISTAYVNWCWLIFETKLHEICSREIFANSYFCNSTCRLLTYFYFWAYLDCCQENLLLVDLLPCATLMLRNEWLTFLTVVFPSFRIQANYNIHMYTQVVHRYTFFVSKFSTFSVTSYYNFYAS